MLPNPYLAIAAVLAIMGAFVGGYLKGGADTGARWEAATERLKAEAATTLAQETARVAAIEASNAELARTIEESHAKATADAAASRDDFARRLSIARRGTGNRCPAAAEAADPGGGADAAPGGGGGPGTDAIGLRLRDYALDLQRYAKACNSWALEVGR